MTKTRTLTMTALMTAVICIFAPISIPIPISPVALTLGTFAMYLTAYVLPPRQALAAIGLYLLLGAAGLPVFSGYTAGLSRFAAPGGGGNQKRVAPAPDRLLLLPGKLYPAHS